MSDEELENKIMECLKAEPLSLLELATKLSVEFPRNLVPILSELEMTGAIEFKDSDCKWHYKKK